MTSCCDLPSTTTFLARHLDGRGQRFDGLDRRRLLQLVQLVLDVSQHRVAHLTNTHHNNVTDTVVKHVVTNVAKLAAEVA